MGLRCGKKILLVRCGKKNSLIGHEILPDGGEIGKNLTNITEIRNLSCRAVTMMVIEKNS